MNDEELRESANAYGDHGQVERARKEFSRRIADRGTTFVCRICEQDLADCMLSGFCEPTLQRIADYGADAAREARREALEDVEGSVLMEMLDERNYHHVERKDPGSVALVLQLERRVKQALRALAEENT